MPWDERDLALAGLAAMAVKADIDSTKKALARGGEETNPLLGRKPSGADLDKAGALAAMLGIGGAMALPDEWRKPALGAWAGLEGGLAKYNQSYNPKKGGGKFSAAIGAALPYSALGGLLGYLMNDSGGATVDVKKGPKGAIELSFGYRKDF